VKYHKNTPGFLLAGIFHIDTGYDSPGGVGDNLAPAREFYQAQVLATGMNFNPYLGGNPCKVRIDARTAFGSTLTPGSGSQNNARVWIRCEVWFSPTSRNPGDFVELTSVNWSLYRV
jgi:hypothetical protein